jgi:hypothetical protein
MAKQQSASFDVSKFVAAGIRVELAALKATQTMLEAQLARFTKDTEVGSDRTTESKAPLGNGRRRRTGGVVANVAGNARRTMSATQRKAVGERMKKYWAAKRAGNAPSNRAGGEEDSVASASSAGAVKRRGPRTMSAEARKRISDAQKARWAAQRGGASGASDSAEGGPAGTRKRRPAKNPQAHAANRGPRKRSAAARKRMSEAQKKRWAARKRSSA